MVDGGIALRPIIDDHIASPLLIHRLLYQPVTKKPRQQYQKESSVLFQGRSLIEQRNFYIPFLITLPLPVRNISTALFDSHSILLMPGQVLGEPLFIDHSYSVSSPPSMHISHWSNSEVPCSLQKDRRQRLHVMKVILTRSPASHR